MRGPRITIATNDAYLECGPTSPLSPTFRRNFLLVLSRRWVDLGHLSGDLGWNNLIPLLLKTIFLQSIRSRSYTLSANPPGFEHFALCYILGSGPLCTSLASLHPFRTGFRNDIASRIVLLSQPCHESFVLLNVHHVLIGAALVVIKCGSLLNLRYDSPQSPYGVFILFSVQVCARS